MADRNSAAIFSSLFTKLAKDSGNEGYARTVAEHMWTQMAAYDFSNQQLECDDELITLGLARETDDGVQYRALNLKGWDDA